MELQRPVLDNKRILLVEDDSRIVNFMQRGLEAEGITLDVVSAKTPALYLAESRRYNTIILDIYLGEDDGLDVCRTLRQRSIDTPVLVMTAKDSMELREATVKAGANAYLPKPFSFDDLLSTLEKMRQAYLTIGKPVPTGLPAQVRA
jgi:DNA-binding response OmpR family regulator